MSRSQFRFSFFFGFGAGTLRWMEGTVFDLSLDAKMSSIYMYFKLSAAFATWTSMFTTQFSWKQFQVTQPHEYTRALAYVNSG